MAYVYSYAFFRGSLEDGVPLDIFTVPSGHTAIVRDLYMRNSNGADTFVLLLDSSGRPAAGSSRLIPPGESETLSLRAVFDAGEVVAAVSIGSAAQIAVCGYLLIGPP